MATTIHPSGATDGRPAASLRLTVRLELSEMLQRLSPRLTTIVGDEDVTEPDVHPSAAREFALDLMEELEARGYAVVRRAGA